MKVCAGISTLNRDTAPMVAKALRPYVDELVVVAQGECNLDDLPSGSIILHQNPGLADARNTILRHAMETNCDIVVECDDDIRVKDVAIEDMLEITTDNPNFGSCGIAADFFWIFGTRKVTTNTKYLLCPFNSQMWASRIDNLLELGSPTWRYDVLDDMDVGMRFWAQGRPCVRVHVDRSSYSVAVYSRLASSKLKRIGGQPISRRVELMQPTVDSMNKEHVPEMIKWLSCTVKEKDEKYREKDVRINVRYNWENMMKKSIDRWGYIGYEDSLGRKI